MFAASYSLGQAFVFRVHKEHHMIRTRMLAAWIAAGLSVCAVAAEKDGVATKQKSEVAESAAPSENTVLDKVVSAVAFDDASLEEVFEFLQKASPGFKAAISREAGVPDDYPRITLKMKDVTVSQILELVMAAHPDFLNIQEIEYGSGIHTVRVSSDPEARVIQEKERPTVNVYNLDSAISHLAQRLPRKPEPGKADPADHVLSLITATLEQVTSKTPPVLRLHPQTQTLIFKGDEMQRAALETVLHALEPVESEEAKELVRMKVESAGYELRLDQLARELEVKTQRHEKEQNALERTMLAEREELKEALSQAMAKNRTLELELEKLRLKLAMLQDHIAEKAKAADPAKQ